MNIDWRPFVVSLQVMAVAIPLIVVLGLGAAIVMSRRQFRGQTIIETALMLPLVLPPSVVGFYMLIGLGRGSPIFEWFGLRILFTWPAAAIAAAIVGLPLMFQASRAGIRGVDRGIEDTARTLGAGEFRILTRITVPLAARGILAGFVLAVARAFGEFGATLMVAGAIPGRTQTLSLAVYEAVQTREYMLANVLVAIMTVISFAALLAVRRGEARSTRDGAT